MKIRIAVALCLVTMLAACTGSVDSESNAPLVEQKEAVADPACTEGADDPCDTSDAIRPTYIEQDQLASAH